jgi:hypothetical protein
MPCPEASFGICCTPLRPKASPSGFHALHGRSPTLRQGRLIQEGRFLDIDSPTGIVERFDRQLLAVQGERVTRLLSPSDKSRVSNTAMRLATACT